MSIVIFSILLNVMIVTKSEISNDDIFNLLMDVNGYNNDWVQQQKLTAFDGPTAEQEFGADVAMAGDQLVVGTQTNYGSAYIYERVNDVWEFKLKLEPDPIEENDRFGFSVDIAEDRIIIGAYDRDPRSDGGAFIYEKENGYWTQVAVFEAPATANEDFGYDVAISANYAAIGDRYDDPSGVGNAGSVYVYERDPDGAWGEVEQLVASDKASSDYFGVSVDIDGDYIVVGANRGGPGDRGAVYTFRRDEQGVWNQIQKIERADTVFTYFRTEVSICGDWLAVGAQTKNTAFVYKRNSDDKFIERAELSPTGAANNYAAVSISENGDVIVGQYIDDDADVDAGAVSIYGDVADVEWVEKKMTLDLEALAHGQFGRSVSMSGDCAAISAPRYDAGDVDEVGAVFI